jgi:hypothetical protein
MSKIDLLEKENINDGTTDPRMFLKFGPRTNPEDNVNTGLFIPGNFSNENQKEILLTMGILLEGDYRENTMSSGIFSLVEQYKHTSGFSREGIHCYSFGLNSSLDYQPSGAINLSKFNSMFEL